jgi:hypothetical protein
MSMDVRRGYGTHIAVISMQSSGSAAENTYDNDAKCLAQRG